MIQYKWISTVWEVVQNRPDLHVRNVLQYFNRAKLWNQPWEPGYICIENACIFFTTSRRWNQKNWLVLRFNNSQVFMTVSINESKPFPHSVGQDLEESFCIVFVISILDSCYMTFLFGSVISKDILKWDKEGKEWYYWHWGMILTPWHRRIGPETEFVLLII